MRPENDPSHPDAGHRGLVLLLGWLALTACIVLIWSHCKLLWVDEFLVLETDSLPTVRQVLSVQRHWPIALDPAVYHLAVHASTRLFGISALAVRLPSLLGFLLMQCMLFLFVRTIAGVRAAVLSAMLPVLSGSFYYASEARPYALLLGWFALAVWSYQQATGDRESALAAWSSTRRGIALCCLAAAIALAENTHYFGVLLLLPLAGAELARTVLRRRIDWRLLLALAAGAACELFTLPFQQAVLRYKQHYYNSGPGGMHALVQAYRLLLLNMQFAAAAERASSVLLLLFGIFCLGGTLWQWRRSRVALSTPVAVLLLLLAALPVAGILIGRFVTHNMEVRYILGAVVALAAMFGIALGPMLRTRASFVVSVALVAGFAVALNTARIRSVARNSGQIRAALRISPAQRTLLLGSADGRIYVQNESWFQVASYYVQDAQVRARLTMLYSFDKEMHAAGRDTNALTADHMRHFTGFRIENWDAMERSAVPHRLLVYGTEWDFAEPELQAAGAVIRPLGGALGGKLIDVWPEQKPMLPPDTVAPHRE